MLNDYLTRFNSSLTGHTELRAQVNNIHAVTLINGNLAANERSECRGVSARVYQNGFYGFASVAEYSDGIIPDILHAARQNAEFLARHAESKKPSLPVIETGKVDLERDIRDLPQRQYIDFAKEIDGYIVSRYHDISRVVRVREESTEKLMMVSDGFCLHSIVPRCYLFVTMTASTAEGSPVEISMPYGGDGYFDECLSDISALYSKIDKQFERLMEKKNGIYAEAGRYDCIISPDLAGILAHEAVGHTVEADLVLGGSVAAYNLTRQVASEMVNLVDFANVAYGKPVPQPIFVDDEGTPCEDAVIIKNGILQGYLNNRESAQHFNVAPKGNARAAFFSDEPLIRMRNTAILPGNDKLEDMIASIEKGYLLSGAGNGQADMTGEFMFNVTNGYEIRNGRIGCAIRDTTISGVAFDVLKTVDMLSDTLEWYGHSSCGKKQALPVGLGGPAVKCKLTLGGR
jgi:Predicted Zn-dependent proteases and their inactivated homologs